MRRTILIITALLALPVLQARADEPLAIVVKKGSKVTGISSGELLKIFRGEEKESGDGTHFALTVRPAGSPERAAFFSQVLHMSDTDYQKYFLRAVFTGLLKSAPKNVSSAGALKAYMDGNDGAIGYVRLSEVDDGFTVVSIDGKNPADAGYPIIVK